MPILLVAELRPYSGGRIDSPFGLHPGLEIQDDVIVSADQQILGWNGNLARLNAAQ